VSVSHQPRSTFVAALRPTRWLVLGVAIAWGMRLAGWLARDAFARTDFKPSGIVDGLASDAILVLALFALSRTLRLRFGPREDDRLFRRSTRALVGSLPAGVAMGSALARAMDLAHCRLARSHWTAEAFLYLDPGFAAHLAEPAALQLIAATIGLGALFVVALRRDALAMAPPEPVPGDSAARWSNLALAVTMGAAAWTLVDGVRSPPHVYATRLIPEVNFARQWFAWRADADPAELGSVHLSRVLRTRLERVGLVAGDVAERPDHPLLRSRLDEPPLDHPMRPGVAADARPNVVLTFVESLNRTFVHALSGRYPGLMPETSTLTDRMTVVEDYYNTSSPTILALVATLCSLHPPSRPRELRPAERDDQPTPYSCLSDHLRQAGYRTVFVGAAPRHATGKDRLLRMHGFDEVLGQEDIRITHPSWPEGSWGVYDDRLVDYVEEQLTRLEALRARDGRPYLLVMLTLDAHHPGMAPPDARLPSALDGLDWTPGARRMLAAYHTTDAAIGKLARRLLNPPRGDRTLWVLTADHAQAMVPRSDRLFPEDEPGWTFDRVPLLLHDPVHALPARLSVLSGSTDLAPTILHLLGLTKGPTSMTGRSIFGSRRDYPWNFGRAGERLAYMQSREERQEPPIGDVREMCANGISVFNIAKAPLTSCELIQWMDWQDALWASHTLLPIEAFHGAGTPATRAPPPPH